MGVTSKSELIDETADHAGLTKRDTKRIVDASLDFIKGALERGERVVLTDFGTFEVRQRQARRGVRPGTTEPIDIPASSYAAFRAAPLLKRRLGN